MRPPLPTLVATTALLLAGCGAAGALGQATLFQECSPADPGCRRATPAAPLAVGARLRPSVQVDVAGSVMPIVALASSRDDVVAIEDGVLVARAPGMAAVLIATADGTVIDFQHVWVAQPTAIVVEQPSPDGPGVEEVIAPIQLVPGEQLVLSSTMVAGAQRLAGEGDLTWSVEPAPGGDGSAIALLRDGSSARRRLVARAPGAARVTVASLGVARSIDVEVLP